MGRFLSNPQHPADCAARSRAEAEALEARAAEAEGAGQRARAAQLRRSARLFQRQANRLEAVAGRDRSPW